MSRITIWEAIAIFLGVGVWFAVVIWGHIAYNNFRVRIQVTHQDLWVSLGRPEQYYYRYPGHNPHALLRSFLWRRRYRTIGDRELTRLGDRALLANGIYLLSFAALVLTVAISR